MTRNKLSQMSVRKFDSKYVRKPKLLSLDKKTKEKLKRFSELNK